MILSEVNNIDLAAAQHCFMQCCTSTTWVNRMAAGRPYASEEALREAADRYWLDLKESDYLEAFDGHPKIGDVSSLRKKYANTKALAAGEQSGMNVADENTIEALAQGNNHYQDKFGFIFIVCATGKSAGEMLALLNARLPNSREQELKNAAEEQRKIFQIRINSLLQAQPQLLASQSEKLREKQ